MKYLLIETTVDGPVIAFDCGAFSPTFDAVRRAWLVVPAAPDVAPVYYTDGGNPTPRLHVETAP